MINLHHGWIVRMVQAWLRIKSLCKVTKVIRNRVNRNRAHRSFRKVSGKKSFRKKVSEEKVIRNRVNRRLHPASRHISKKSIHMQVKDIKLHNSQKWTVSQIKDTKVRDVSSDSKLNLKIANNLVAHQSSSLTPALLQISGTKVFLAEKNSWNSENKFGNLLFYLPIYIFFQVWCRGQNIMGDKLVLKESIPTS